MQPLHLIPALTFQGLSGHYHARASSGWPLHRDSRSMLSQLGVRLVQRCHFEVSSAKASLRRVSMSCKNCAIFLFYHMKCVLQHNVHTKSIKLWFLTLRADSRLAPSQWETSLQSNTFSHWLGANLEASLYSDNLQQDCYVQCLSNRAGISLAMRPANDRRRYIVTTSLIDWVHS